nr:MAG TPA_asm: hypothetical protein [Caudoviricetes sp.]
MGHIVQLSRHGRWPDCPAELDGQSSAAAQAKAAGEGRCVPPHGRERQRDNTETVW